LQVGVFFLKYNMQKTMLVGMCVSCWHTW
jgi:hypothetical protein